MDAVHFDPADTPCAMALSSAGYGDGSPLPRLGAIGVAMLLNIAQALGSATIPGSRGAIAAFEGPGSLPGAHCAGPSPGGHRDALRLRGGGGRDKRRPDSPDKKRRGDPNRPSRGPAEEDDLGSWDGSEGVLDEGDLAKGEVLEDVIKSELVKKFGDALHEDVEPPSASSATKTSFAARASMGDRGGRSPREGKGAGAARAKDARERGKPGARRGGAHREVFERDGLEFERPASDIDEILDALSEEAPPCPLEPFMRAVGRCGAPGRPIPCPLR